MILVVIGSIPISHPKVRFFSHNRCAALLAKAPFDIAELLGSSSSTSANIYLMRGCERGLIARIANPLFVSSNLTSRSIISPISHMYAI